MINERVIYGRRLIRRHSGVWVCGETTAEGRTCGFTHPHIELCEHLIEALERVPRAARVSNLRCWRGLTQQDLGVAVHRSKSWVDKVERGVRDLDKVSVLEDLAEALQVHPALLLLSSQPTPRTHHTRRANAGGHR